MAFGGRLFGAVLLIGAGAVAVAAVVAAPVVLRRARPLIREGLKRSLGLYERARATAAEFAEDVQDLVAEVRQDLTAEQRPAGPASVKAEAGEREA